MNTFTFEEISVGYSHDFVVTINEEMLNDFFKLSGDNNPLHINKSFALSKGFKGRVVYGMLTSSFYSRLVGVYIPGENCLLHSLEVKFTKPVYVNDELVVRGTVYKKNDTFKLLTIKADIKNTDGVVVSKAIIKTGFLI